ncbi:6026_t:CDS:2 [Funneliformis geosporum]|uniref:6026_t:CDS:1 n=1 Tax=Funneliformis geosporum TaxID=1117311 RepID=A0A9W4SNK6_9GLOM|nr:6026_t:CDS:2 [Funneliformis geosporum]
MPKKYRRNSVGDYNYIYFKTDVLSFVNVWTEFQKMSMEYYELDFSHYVSALSQSWDAQLKMTE